MGVEKAEPQEQIVGLVEDGAAGTLAPDAGTQLGSAPDKFKTETLQRSSQDPLELKFSIYSSYNNKYFKNSFFFLIFLFFIFSIFDLLGEFCQTFDIYPPCQIKKKLNYFPFFPY